MSDKRAAPRSTRGSLPQDALVSHRYIVRELLGRGGMGYVYRAFDTARGHDVALKQLRSAREASEKRPSSREPSLDDALAGEPARFDSKRPTLKHPELDAARQEQRLSLFQREYHTLAELAHPRIIEAYDYGFEQGVPYYTMELLTGRDISTLAPSPWPRVCAVMRDLASALTLLHSRRLLHRDLSPSNVHQQRDGFCKLIDFGAMGSMGKPTEIVGTPPFMPPELLRQQALDARADLYSLGALAYYLLAGRTVHPVRSLAELYNFMEARPAAPSTYAMSIPRALDALLLQLLSPDPAARPSSTVEVLERLSAIDGVEHESALRSMPISVSTPELVGLRGELKWVQKRLALAVRGKGTSLLVTGARGSGRSRFLDACALQGRLSGARVLRSAADTSAPAPYGVISTLLRQLQASLGAAERAQLAIPADVLAALLPSVSAKAVAANDAQSSDWTSVGVNLLSFLSRVAAHRCVMLTIDDLDRVDTPSATLIAALAQRAESDNLVVVAAVDSAAANTSEAVRAFKGRARELTLTALAPSETQSLLGSVFGDVPNLGLLATRVHSLSAGNPRLTMELAQHLVDAGVIRCETGGYLLPEVLSGNDLPTSLGEALRSRIRGLSPSAQALASTLAICTGVPLSAEESFAITELGAQTEGPEALAELHEANIAEVRGTNVTLRQAAMADALRRVLPAPARRALHARVAAELASDPTRMVHAADQYFLANLPSEAVDALLAVTTNSYAGRTWHPGYASLAERGVEACTRFGRPARDAFTLQNALVQQVVAYNEPYERAQLLSFCQLLSRLSGLADWAELSPALPDAERLAAALKRAEERYQATPEHERTLAPGAAIRQLVSYLGKIAGFASMAYDLDLFAALPSLAPLVPLNPTIAIIESLVKSLRDLREGRVESYLTAVDTILDRLAQPDDAGFPPAEARGLAVNLLYGVALTNAAIGRPIAFEQAREMENFPSHRVNAWRVRQNAHLFFGESDAAEACRREVELLQVQEGPRQFHQGGTIDTEAMAYAFADDLLGLRRVLPGIEEMAARHPGWRPKLLVTRAALQRVRGRLKESLSLCEEALELVPPAKHTVWALAAACQLQVLIELGRAKEAHELGLAYVDLAEDQDLHVTLHQVELPLADAEAALGMYGEARARVERMIEQSLLAGHGGVPVGVMYEAGARHAVLARDGEAFRHYYAGCTQHLKYGRSAAITARLDRLNDQARSVGIAPAREGGDGRQELNTGLVISQMSRCNPDERGAQALKLLMTATGASAGHLFKVNDGGLKQLASFSALPAPPYLCDFLLRYLQSAEVVNDQTVDVTYHTSLIEPDRTIEPVLLSATRDAERMVVGVAALSFAGGRRWPDPKLLETIAEQLFSD
jgi:serine/threonine-protein kinase